MNRLLLILLFVPGFLQAQKIPDYGLYKVRILEADKIELIEINPVSGQPKLKKDRFYYWYMSDNVHMTQGGFSGQRLNGMYNAYYPDKNLKEQGVFENGLKTGTWKNWKDDGTLYEVSNWKEGIKQPDIKVPFWKKLHLSKLNVFKKKKDTLPVAPTPKSK